MESFFISLLFVAGFVAIIIISIMKSIRNSESSFDSDGEQLIEDENVEIEDFDKQFFDATSNGERSQYFLELSSQQDCSIIRGLLQADNIPSYIEGEYMNAVYGFSNNMNAIFSMKLYILCKDYDKAYEIVRTYMESKRQKFSENKAFSPGEAALNIMSVVTSSATSATQDCMGITVMSKTYED